MNTEISRVDAAINHAVSELNSVDFVIDELQQRARGVIVGNAEDEQGYASCKTLLKKVVTLRTDVEKKRKALKADALRYGKAVDSEAKRITSLIEPIESHLKTQKAIVDDAKKAAEEAAERERMAVVRERMQEAADAEWMVLADDLAAMAPEEFQMGLITARRLKSERDAERAELEAFRAAKAQEPTLADVAETELQRHLRLFAAMVETLSIPVELMEFREQILDVLGDAASRIESLA